MFSFLRRLVVAVLALIGLAVVVAGAMLVQSGLSARVAPGPLETAVAPRLRSLAIPASARDTKNPVAATREAIADGLEHFADHCAICHGNDGSGDTKVGRSLSPRVPDMRKPATQNLSDGELFYIIENGVRFTGMPAWAHEDPADSWNLVHFIRHQPKLTPAELARMKGLNPVAPDEATEEKTEKGKKASPAATPPHLHKHGA
jgi:mono/diheme cytochrome c family protein